MANPGKVTPEYQHCFVTLLRTAQKAANTAQKNVLSYQWCSRCLHIVISGPNREVSGGLDPTAVTSQYRRGGSPVPSSVPECSDSHELETLMPPGSHEHGHLLEEASEEQSLMGSANQREEEDAPAPDPKVSVTNLPDWLYSSYSPLTCQ